MQAAWNKSLGEDSPLWEDWVRLMEEGSSRILVQGVRSVNSIFGSYIWKPIGWFGGIREEIQCRKTSRKLLESAGHQGKLADGRMILLTASSNRKMTGKCLRCTMSGKKNQFTK